MNNIISKLQAGLQVAQGWWGQISRHTAYKKVKDKFDIDYALAALVFGFFLFFFLLVISLVISLVIWFVISSDISFDISFDIASWLTILFFVWFALGYDSVNTDERVIRRLFGTGYGIAESGLRWAPFKLKNSEFWFYPTGQIELQLPHLIMGRLEELNDRIHKLEQLSPSIETLKLIDTLEGQKYFGVLTRAKKDSSGVSVPAINMGMMITFYFRYPETQDKLIECARLLPDPQNHEKLLDFLSERITDPAKNVAGQWAWTDIWQLRQQFCTDVHVAISALPQAGQQGVVLPIGQIIYESGLRDLTIGVPHIHVPREVKDAIPAEAAAMLRQRGAIIDADTKKIADIKDGEARAQIERLLFEAIEEKPGRARLRGFSALEKMAEGDSTKFVFPTDIIGQLGEILGNRGAPARTLLDEIKQMSDQDKKDLVTEITKLLGQSGGTP